MVRIMELPQLLANYHNGNAYVKIYDDGTRIIESEDDEFEFDFPCNIDVCITQNCDNQCPFCYANCTPDGKHADILNKPYLNNIHPGTEVAINLNSCNHPKLIPFLQNMYNRGVIVSGTINQIHFMKCHRILRQLCKEKLLFGLGISLVDPTDEFLDLVKDFPNCVIHVINGVVTTDQIIKLANRDLRLLILGYKDIGRGVGYKVDHYFTVQMRQYNLKNLVPSLRNWFKTVSFDNLALVQLKIKNYISKDEWDLVYQGDEGTISLYIDAVHDTFAVSSLESQDRVMQIGNKTIEEMFQVVKSVSKANKN